MQVPPWNNIWGDTGAGASFDPNWFDRWICWKVSGAVLTLATAHCALRRVWDWGRATTAWAGGTTPTAPAAPGGSTPFPASGNQCNMNVELKYVPAGLPSCSLIKILSQTSFAQQISCSTLIN